MDEFVDLIFVRHATAAPLQAGKSDAGRPLTDQGIREAHGAAYTLAGLLLPHADRAPVLLASPYQRTMQTASLISQRLGTVVTPDRALAADRTVQDMIDAVLTYSSSPVIVVGHMPTIALCIAALLHVSVPVLDVAPATIIGMRWQSRQQQWAIVRWVLPPLTHS